MRVSIVTLSYNQARYLPHAIDSVASQRRTHDDLEYIVVDPGSTDGSRSIISRHEAAIDKLLLDPDSGPSEGLNNGFRVSTGKILGFVNADDGLEPEAISRVVSFFRENPDIDVVTGALRNIDAHGRARWRLQAPVPFSAQRFCLGLCTVLQPSTFFRRRAWDMSAGFNENNTTSWDAELLVDMALAGARFGLIKHVLGEFRVHDASITSRAQAVSSDDDVILASRMHDDLARICSKVFDADADTSSRVRLGLSRAWFRLRPTKRIEELLHCPHRPPVQSDSSDASRRRDGD